MPEGRPARPAEDAAEQQAVAADARLVRSVRWRLVAWAGGTTLLVLLALGALLYVSVARSLESAGRRQLEDRADVIRAVLTRTVPQDPDTGFLFGSATFAMVVDGDGRPLVRPQDRIPDGLPNLQSIDAAAQGGLDVRVASAGDGVPTRVLTERIDLPARSVFVQVTQDRTAEQRTLDVMLAVLLVGGGVVVLVAFGVGALYARRALVPIRDSLGAQRTALRRQREFAADASHELRTPLTVIRSSIEHLRRHPDEPVARVGQAVDDIDAEVAHLTALVDDLLLLARSDSGAVPLERLPVDLGDVAADAASSLVMPAERRGVRVVVDPEPAVVSGDAIRLRQLVTILVDNAIRYSPRGGEVRVAVRSDGTAAELDVTDQGPGVRPEDAVRVFERFWRAPGAPSGGTGLGLAIAKWIVDRHGGRIDVVTSADQAGARFRVVLPAESLTAS